MIFWNKNATFKAIKTKSSKRRKVYIFLKGLVHGFGPKLAILPTFLFTQYRPAKYVL